MRRNLRRKKQQKTAVTMMVIILILASALFAFNIYLLNEVSAETNELTNELAALTQKTDQIKNEIASYKE